MTRAHRRPPAGGSSRAFSLVEVLVVVGILIVLAALIIPAAWYVRQRARVFRCTANLHELSVAIALYVNDYQAIPLVYPDVQPGINGPKSKNPGGPNGPIVPPEPPPWFDVECVLGDYISTPETFICPVAHAMCPAWPPDWGPWWVPGNSGRDPAMYSFNEFASGLKVSQVYQPPSRALMMFDPLSWDLRWPHLRRLNALFLDGHVKGYEWIYPESPWAHNAGWPPD